MSLFINPYDKNLPQKVLQLKPMSGYCFIIDIAGSTELKDIDLSKWIIFIYNTFANIMGNLFMKFNPIKSLGDALMFFIPEDNMKDENPLTLFHALWNIISSDEPNLREVKIGVTFCEDAYDITFVPDTVDVYGKDIDLTARLSSLAESQEIIMNVGFAEKVRGEYNISKDRETYSEVLHIKGPWPTKISGFADYQSIYKVTK